MSAVLMIEVLGVLAGALMIVGIDWVASIGNKPSPAPQATT